MPLRTKEWKEGKKNERSQKKRTDLLHPEDLRLVPSLKNHAAGFFFFITLH